MLVAGRVLRVSADKKYSDGSNKSNADTSIHTSINAEDAEVRYHWDYTNCFNALSVMSVPSPNGSTSSIFSSEDSSSAASTYSSSRQSTHQHQQQQFLHLQQQQQQPSASGSLSGSSQSSGSGKPIKLCRVCGDRAKSYHFGGISCDSCKAFFRRSVQNDAYRNFHCPYDGHCDINITSRKCCQHCRFKKCISIGMEKGWVMSDEERLQMLKNRLERKKHSQSDAIPNVKHNISPYEPDLSQINNYLSDSEVKTIENVMSLYTRCSKEITFNEQLYKSRDKSINRLMSRTQILDIFFTAIKQFASFAQQFESFTDIITHNDQQILLRGSVMELCFIRGAFLYNEHVNGWILTDDEQKFVISADDLKIMVTQSLHEKHLNFIKTFKKLHIDEPTAMLLTVIVLLSSDRSGLCDSVSVQNEQEKYLLLLKKYMDWRYGQRASLLYPKLLMILINLRELSEAHADYSMQLLLCKEESEEIKQRLSSLNIDNQLDVQNATVTPLLWSFEQCLPKPIVSDRYKEYGDEELSTSSEGSEKIPSD